MKRVLRIAILLLLVLPFAWYIGHAQGAEKKSPFIAVKWQDNEPVVRFNDEWYRLEKIDKLTADQILDYCKKEYKEKWQKRFAEDLVEVMQAMGHPPGPTVQLQLSINEKSYTYTGQMTEENRRKVVAYNRDVKAAPAIEKTLTKEEVAEDLAVLQEHIQSSFAYASYKGFDYRAAIRLLQQKAADTIAANIFAIQVQQLLASFGDGHSGVDDLSDKLPQGYLPFAVAAVDGKVLCVSPGGRELLRDSYPYLTSVNGITTHKLLEAATVIVPSGSSQFVRYHATARLAFINYLLAQLHFGAAKDLQIVLENEKGKTISITLPISADRHKPAPILPPSQLTTGIGYLRIPQMSSSADLQQQLRDTMNSLRHTAGLIIDIRDNPGGSRDILQVLAPFFIPQHTSIVVNAAVLRTDESKNADDLSDRDLYPDSHINFDQQDRKAIAGFQNSFRPQWKFPADRYSDWHYMVLKSKKDIFYYNKPVMLLINSGCFSAADIFAAAFREFPQVTLVGTPTGGGSGRARKYRLPNSGIEVKLSTMVSFKPDGGLFDHNGVMPDIIVEETVTDLLRQTDTQLDRAVAELNKKRQ